MHDREILCSDIMLRISNIDVGHMWARKWLEYVLLTLFAHFSLENIIIVTSNAWLCSNHVVEHAYMLVCSHMYACPAGSGKVFRDGF